MATLKTLEPHAISTMATHNPQPTPPSTPVATHNPQPTPPSTPVKKSLYDKSLAATANLAMLLPTGTTLAFQTLVPSFTNHGNCYHINRIFSWGLVGFLSSLCAVLSFTDSITDSDGNTYYGLALLTSRGFHAFNYDYKGQLKDDKNKKNCGQQTQFQCKDDKNKNTQGKDGTNDFKSACEKRRVKLRDFTHAFFRALVFLSLAFDNAELQSCLLGSRMTVQWKEFLVNTPLATGLLASFVFMIFPSYRKGIGYEVDAADSSPPTPSEHQNKGSGSKQPSASSSPSNQPNMGGVQNPIKSSLQITDVAQVVPSTSYELDPIV